MSIKLSYYLSKNRIDLNQFCIQMKFKSYHDIFVYCAGRNIICDILKDDADNIFKTENKESNEEKIIKKPAAKTRRRSRKSKAKTARTSTPKDDS